MTREEAIAYGEDYLKDLISACCHIEEKHKDFVRMAINALEQEPCEDAVSRQAVMELQKLRIQLKRIKEILEVKGMASNVKVSMIEEVVKGDEK